MEKNIWKCIKMAVIAINFTFIISPSKWINFNVQFLPFFPSQAALRLEKKTITFNTVRQHFMPYNLYQIIPALYWFYHVYSVISFGDSWKTLEFKLKNGCTATVAVVSRRGEAGSINIKSTSKFHEVSNQAAAFYFIFFHHFAPYPRFNACSVSVCTVKPSIVSSQHVLTHTDISLMVFLILTYSSQLQNLLSHTHSISNSPFSPNCKKLDGC